MNETLTHVTEIWRKWFRATAVALCLEPSPVKQVSLDHFLEQPAATLKSGVFCIECLNVMLTRNLLREHGVQSAAGGEMSLESIARGLKLIYKQKKPKGEGGLAPKAKGGSAILCDRDGHEVEGGGLRVRRVEDGKEELWCWHCSTLITDCPALLNGTWVHIQICGRCGVEVPTSTRMILVETPQMEFWCPRCAAEGTGQQA